MGWVWTVMLSIGDEEFWTEGENHPRDSCEPLERINAWMPHGKLISLIEPTYADGIGSGMEAYLFGGDSSISIWMAS